MVSIFEKWVLYTTTPAREMIGATQLLFSQVIGGGQNSFFDTTVQARHVTLL
jgi:hypothetical protein